MLLLPADMRPADSPSTPFGGAPALSGPGRGKVVWSQTRLRMRSWTRLARSGTFLATASRRSSQIAHGPLYPAATLAQFALDADAGFADLALEPVAGGDAATLESAQLGLGLGGGPVARDRVVHARNASGRGRSGRRRRESGRRARRSRRRRRRRHAWSCRSAGRSPRPGWWRVSAPRRRVLLFLLGWCCVRSNWPDAGSRFSRWPTCRRISRRFSRYGRMWCWR